MALVSKSKAKIDWRQKPIFASVRGQIGNLGGSGTYSGEVVLPGFSSSPVITLDTHSALSFPTIVYNSVSASSAVFTSPRSRWYKVSVQSAFSASSSGSSSITKYSMYIRDLNTQQIIQPLGPIFPNQIIVNYSAVNPNQVFVFAEQVLFLNSNQSIFVTIGYDATNVIQIYIADTTITAQQLSEEYQ
jgi:hypothetical protein